MRRPALEARIRGERRAALVVDVLACGGEVPLRTAQALLEGAGVTVESAVAVQDQAGLLLAVNDAVADGEPLVVVGGGDGTFRAVVGAFADREVAVRGKVVAVDLARLDGEVFANVAVLGFQAGIARAAPHGAKRRLGTAAYLLYETPYLLSQTLFSATITTPGGT